MRLYHLSIHTMRYLVVIRMMLLLSVFTISLIPLADMLSSPVLGQASIVADAFCSASRIINNPADLLGSDQQLCGINSPPAPPVSIPPLELQQPIIPVPPEASVISGSVPGLDGLVDPFLGSLIPDLAETQSQSIAPQLSLTSSISSSDSINVAQSTIYACMDVTTGNIPVNSLKPSLEPGCPFQTLPIVIIIDDSSDTVSTCFVAPDLVTRTDNCIPSASPLQQQQQQAIAPPILPFQ
jgi:hypothetical protein